MNDDAFLHAIAIGLVVLGQAACKRGDDAVASSDAGEPPSWLGDAGLVARPPVERPLHALCGIAGNPPLGDDATSTTLRKEYFAAAKDLGNVMLRVDFLWKTIEPEKGKLDFSQYDRLLADAAPYGTRFLGILCYGNGWASAASKGDMNFPPDDPADYARYAGATAEHFKGKLAGWEVWNEPNNGFRFWKTSLYGDPDGYGTLLRATHDATRAVDPTTPVLLGGTVFTPQLIHGAMQWLGEAYLAHPDLATAFEIAAVHTYPAYPPERAPEVGEEEDPPLEAKLQMHAWLLAQHGGEKKPIWVTELGWPVYGKVDEAAQARYLVRATILSAYAGAEAVFWFTLRDGPKPTEFPPEDAFGLLRNDGDPAAGKDGTPKPSYLALKTLLARVGERWATTRDPRISSMPKDARAVVFHGASGGDVIAVWTVETASASVRLDGRAADLFDQSGKASGSVAAGGSFAIGPDVTYVAER
jgi:hypothetical protein